MEQLASARQTCPRMGFCSNKELSEMLTGLDKFVEKSHMIFENESTFIVEGGEITGLKDKKGEKLMFDAPVKVDGIPEAAQAAIGASQKAVRREIEKAMQIEGGTMDVFNSDCINQAIEVNEMIRNTREMEAAIDGGEEGVKAYLEQMKAKLDMLSTQSRKDHGPVRGQMLDNLICLNVHHQMIVKNLAQTWAQPDCIGVKTIKNQLWSENLRMYWEDGLVVRIHAYEPKYGYDYLGVYQRLVVTPLTVMAYKEYARAFFQGNAITAEGPAGSGKTETAKDFNRHMGKMTIVCDCSDQMTSDILKLICEYSMASGCCLCFDEFNRVLPEHVNGALEPFSKLARMENQGLTTTQNPNYQGRTALPLEFYKVFSRINMLIPDFALIMEVMLYKYGLAGGASEASQKIMTARAKCLKLLKENKAADFGMRAMKHIAVSAGKLCVGGADPIDSAKTAFHAMYWPLMKFCCRQTYHNIMVETFGDAKLVDMCPEFKAKFAEAHKDADDHYKMKAAQIYEKSMVRHALIVLGKDTKIIEDVNAVIGGSCIMLDATKDLDKFYDETMPNAMRKAAESENVWIVIKKQEDIIWPEFYENCNTVADDNKVLAMKNGERIPLAPTAKLVVLASSCDGMSPAAVSRNGIVDMHNNVAE